MDVRFLAEEGGTQRSYSYMYMYSLLGQKFFTRALGRKTSPTVCVLAYSKSKASLRSLRAKPVGAAIGLARR